MDEFKRFLETTNKTQIIAFASTLLLIENMITSTFVFLCFSTFKDAICIIFYVRFLFFYADADEIKKMASPSSFVVKCRHLSNVIKGSSAKEIYLHFEKM